MLGVFLPLLPQLPQPPQLIRNRVGLNPTRIDQQYHLLMGFLLPPSFLLLPSLILSYDDVDTLLPEVLYKL